MTIKILVSAVFTFVIAAAACADELQGRCWAVHSASSKQPILVIAESQKVAANAVRRDSIPQPGTPYQVSSKRCWSQLGVSHEGLTQLEQAYKNAPSKRVREDDSVDYLPREQR